MMGRGGDSLGEALTTVLPKAKVWSIAILYNLEAVRYFRMHDLCVCPAAGKVCFRYVQG